jgi:hypothetical protein
MISTLMEAEVNADTWVVVTVFTNFVQWLQMEGCRVRQPTLKVDSDDRIKLSSLHRSGNISYYK